MSDLIRQLFTPQETPLDEPCPRCGEDALVKIQAVGWGPWGGAVECKACTERNTLPSFLAKSCFKVEPLDPPK